MVPLPPPAQARGSDLWKVALGQRVRQLRQDAGLTLKALAEASGLSMRFLSEMEAGRANPSLGSLRDLAAALGVEVLALLDPAGSDARRPDGASVPARAPDACAALHALVETLDAGAAAAALRLLKEARLDRRISPVALVGLRGAGKSSVGARLAARLERPFLELDRLIEREAGMGLGDLFELHGEERVRQLERRVLARVLDSGEPAVLATGGGLVTHPDSWALLDERAVTVWLKATPQQHWDRVVAQGDLRPMANRSRARAELEALYQAREPLYARAQRIVDTSDLQLDAVVDRLAAQLGVSPRR